ncbi:MAG: Hsp20/alpha crystallin family protein [bacterium]|nr:Hsp20/alpha crystallin family protein [bacterium]
MKETTVPAETEQHVPDTRDDARTLVPAVDIFDTEEGLAVVADLPGVDKADVDVRVEDGVLTLKAAPSAATPGEVIHREYRFMNYFRQFQLSEKVDQDNIRAEMKHGVVVLHLPKKDEEKPQHISVSVS